MASDFQTIMDVMSAQIVANTDIEAVYSGFENNSNKKLYAEYGTASVPPAFIDSNGVIDTKHEIIYIVISDNEESINEALEAMKILWKDETRAAFWQASTTGLVIEFIDIDYAQISNSASESAGSIIFEFKMRTNY